MERPRRVNCVKTGGGRTLCTFHRGGTVQKWAPPVVLPPCGTYAGEAGRGTYGILYRPERAPTVFNVW